MNVEVRMPYDGDMTVDLSASDFDIASISAFDSNDQLLADSDSSDSVLTVHDLTHSGDYSFVIEGASGVATGTFDIVIPCSSDAPTRSPSADPTASPTANPSSDPTRAPSEEPTSSPSEDPTVHPTSEPTEAPSADPTKQPTEDPTSSPTTPAPTHPGELVCGSHTTGDYNGEPVNVEVRMPYDG